MDGLVLDTEADAAAALLACHEAAVAAEIGQALSIAALCDLHRVDEMMALEGLERWVSVGAAGTPDVGEFVAGEIAALLGVSVGSAFERIATVLNLRHRHPTLWAAFLAGQVRYWEGAHVARAAAGAGLDAEACARFDRLCAQALRIQPWQRVRSQIEKWIIQVDPEGAAERATARAADRHVTLGQVVEGHTDLWGCLDAADGIALDEALDHVADLIEGGPKRHRRAAALGVLARMVFGQDTLPTSEDGQDGDDAWSLLTADGHPVEDYLPIAQADPGRHSLAEVATGTPGCGGNGDSRADGTSQAGCPAGTEPGAGLHALITPVPRRTELVVHLTGADLTDPDTGVISIDGWGHTLLPHLEHLLSGCQVTVRPVITGADLPAVDAHRVPAAMRLAVEARNPVDVFPYGVKRSRACEMDHTRAFDHIDWTGMKQTHGGNLGPLSRFTHRLKTHGGWHLRQLDPGIYHWTSPLGYQYLVTAAGTMMIARPTLPKHRRSHTDIAKRE